VAARGHPAVTDADWVAYYREAETRMIQAIARQASIWLNGDAYNNGYLAAEEEARQSRARWEERLTALNAYMDARP